MKQQSSPFVCGDYKLDLGERTHLMGILNATPDSFYDGGNYSAPESALKKVEQMVENGADFIDVGGESTRPGAKALSAKEEKERVLPIIRVIKKFFSTPISVDTYKSETAEAVLGEGACIINDIGGLLLDPKMAQVAARNRAGVIVMHMKGVPQNMQNSPQYGNLLKEIATHLQKGISKGLEAGLGENQFLVDPGIGFGKTLAHNLEIIKNLSFFLDLKKPILVGLSRKSFLGEITGLPTGERLESSLVASVVAILNGAKVLRTHDIKETKRAVQIADLFKVQQK